MNIKSSTLAIAFSLLVSGVAFAEETASSDDVKKAAAAFDAGRNAYRAESYIEAAENFEAADGHAASAKALRLAFVARKAAGQVDRAATLAALALEKYPEDEAIRTDATPIVEEASSTLGKIEVSCDSASDLLLDGKVVHRGCEAKRTLFVAPGSHKLRAGWSKQRSVTESIDVAAGASVTVQFAEPPMPPEPAAPPTNTQPTPADHSAAAGEKSGGWSPVVFWTGAGLTAAGIGASVFLGVRAINEPGQEAVRENCQTLREECPEYKQGVENQMIANIAIGATAAVGAFTIVSAFLTDWSGDDAEPQPMSFRTGRFTVSPIVAAGDGAQFGARGTF